MIGSQLSHCEITAKLGEGGMGAVSRIRDSKLGREVALKVLPEDFTADAERLARFERESAATASDSLSCSHWQPKQTRRSPRSRW
jgi:serine/threonine protein kinase